MRTQWLITVLVSVMVAACSAGTATDGGSDPANTRSTATPTLSANFPSAVPATAQTSPPGGSVDTYRGNAARTGVMPGPGPEGSPDVAWRFAAGGPFASSPVVRDGVVFAVSGDGVVHAVGLATGDERWSVELGSEASASPLIVGDLLVVADAAGVVRALGTVDGKPRWTARTDGPISGSPAADVGRIVVATRAGSAYALDASSGEIVWHVDLGEPAMRSVAITDGVAYIGLGGAIVAVAVTDGTVRWRVNVASSGAVGTPTVADGIVFAATGLDGETDALGVAAIEAATGTVRWRYTSPSHAQLYTPAVSGGNAYVIGHDRMLVALDASLGRVKWSTEQPSEVEALPVIVDNVLYLVGNDGPATAIDAATGKSLWSVPVQGVPFAPAVVDGYLLVGTDVGTLYAIGGPRP